MKKKHKPNRMTLDRLAASMQRELLGVGREFDALDGKIDRMQVEIVDEVRKENLKVPHMTRYTSDWKITYTITKCESKSWSRFGDRSLRPDWKRGAPNVLGAVLL